MENLNDILTHGNVAEAAGEPIVPYWPQVRGAILLIGQAFDLEIIRPEIAASTLPEAISELSAEQQARLVTPESYRSARTAVLRLLALYGPTQDPWEAIRAFTRRAGRGDIENALYHLRAPARDAGLLPADITTDWFNQLDQAAGPGTSRGSLRGGATAFNKLWALPDVVASGLLPPAKIGPFRSYDRLGRPMHDPPPLLRKIRDDEPAVRGAIDSLWQCICVSGQIDLPQNPGALDFLDKKIWARICDLPGSLIGVTESSMDQYRKRFSRSVRKLISASG